MSAPNPKTKAQELIEQIGRRTKISASLTDFQIARYSKEIKVLFQTPGVDLGDVWMCQGSLCAMTNRPSDMCKAFEMARQYGAKSSVHLFNQASDYEIYGYYEEAAKGFSKSYDEEAQGHILKIAYSTLKFDLIESLILPKYVPEITALKEMVLKIGLNVKEAQEIIKTFIEILQSKNVRLILVNWKVLFDEYQMFFEANTDDEMVKSILNEFDNKVVKLNLFETSTKINIILTTARNYSEVAA